MEDSTLEHNPCSFRFFFFSRRAFSNSLFAFFRDTFDEEEFIDEITHVLTYNMNVNEKLVLYKYLIENIGIDKTRYHDIYESYVENLSIYFTNTQKNKNTRHRDRSASVPVQP